MAQLENVERVSAQEAQMSEQRQAAQQEQLRKMENIELDVAPECAVCMLTMVRPSQLPCKHVFCNTCVEASMNFKWECPMCRFVPPKGFAFTVSEALKEQIKGKTEPEIWQEREEQVAAYEASLNARPQAEESKSNSRADAASRSSANRGQNQVAAANNGVSPRSAVGEVVDFSQGAPVEEVHELRIRYGNRHKLIANAPLLKNGRRRNHEWNVYATLDGHHSKMHDLFESVTFILPNCYANRHRTILANANEGRTSKNWFNCTEQGWGTVNV